MDIKKRKKELKLSVFFFPPFGYVKSISNYSNRDIIIRNAKTLEFWTLLLSKWNVKAHGFVIVISWDTNQLVLLGDFFKSDIYGFHTRFLMIL